MTTTTTTMRVTSHSLRPLRQPLSSAGNGSTRRPSAEYGKITRKHASLPIFPTANAVKIVRLSSSSPMPLREEGGSWPPILAEIRDTAQIRDTAPGEVSARATSARTPSNNHNENEALKSTSRHKEEAFQSRSHRRPDVATTTRTTSTTMKRLLSRDAPGRVPHRCVAEKNTRRQQQHQQVRFHTVRVCYYDCYEQSQPPPSRDDAGGEDMMMTMELDEYERRRGPPRPRRFFAKSPTELRRYRRWRQIEDNIADDEWKAMRQQQMLQQVTRSTPTKTNIATAATVPPSVSQHSIVESSDIDRKYQQQPEKNMCLFKFLCGRRRSQPWTEDL